MHPQTLETQALVAGGPPPGQSYVAMWLQGQGLTQHMAITGEPRPLWAGCHSRKVGEQKEEGSPAPYPSGQGLPPRAPVLRLVGSGSGAKGSGRSEEARGLDHCPRRKPLSTYRLGMKAHLWGQSKHPLSPGNPHKEQQAPSQGARGSPRRQRGWGTQP